MALPVLADPFSYAYFLDFDGTLAEIYALHPFDENTVSSRGEDLRFALETNQGWYQANGVKPGARLDLKALAEAEQGGAQPQVKDRKSTRLNSSH